MGWILAGIGLLGLGTLVAKKTWRPNYFLASLVFLVIGFTQILDSSRFPSTPDFAQPSAKRSSEGSELNGSIKYSQLEWAESTGKKFITGKLESSSPLTRDLRIIFELFDLAGNSLGTVTQQFNNLLPGKSAQIKVLVDLPEAKRFILLRLYSR